MRDVTYGRLEEVLFALGFTFFKTEEKNKIYRHEATGALVVLPEFAPADVVLSRHLLGIKAILQAYGIADEVDLASQLQKAS